ncbi:MULTISPECIES: hypothetical protein [Streptomyces]|uniref:hypothetical protein n=1 Tax=Streptomyces TaxID=1883 RepID=UPI001CCCB875|nr:MULTISPECIES: hypothetical protein [Streptomyces]UBI37108.1 hypothetical protein K7I03_11970 [Streptomyces mobaraensis]UKW29704.1 hypothetical protein MCU78_11945 [Streptomyces sp. TYQ1024]
MTARRPLLTAVAAGALLCVGWLVPAAHATTAHPAPPATHPSAPAPDAGHRLADSGSVDTTPYVYGGVGFVAAGGALITLAIRRSRASGPSGI